MLSMVKEIGIFVVIAQAILYFVPGEAYVKYVKVLIGVMLIAKLVSPVFSLLEGEAWDEIVFQGEVLSEELQKQPNVPAGSDSYENLMKHYIGIVEEKEGEQQGEAMDE